MLKVKIGQGDWIVVCDGRKALILENAGDEKFPNLRTKEVLEQKNPPTHVQGADAPGRSISSVGSARSAVGQTDWHDEAERTFLHDLAHHLDVAVNSGHARSLIMVAPPRALGMIRSAYSPAVRQAVRQEVDKDFVRMPVHEIEKHLTG
ncbi:MAG: host attachment protein [Rhizobiales bacterium]|nr:host attachment protein [Hyphomicrobiales bacterium]